MPPVLPQAEMSRRRLVDVVRKLDVVKRKIEEVEQEAGALKDYIAG